MYNCFDNLKRIFALGLVFLLVLTDIPFAFAEEQKTDLEYLRTQEQAAQEVGALAEEARQGRILQGYKKVLYAEILVDPDNPEQNYRYAIQQIQEGNLLAAASSLERMLLINPELNRVRLLYAVVLYRLDNLEEAEQTLDQIIDLEMEDSLRKEVNFYRKAIRLKQKRTRFELKQTVGWGVDYNRNAAPSSKRRFFFGAPLGLAGVNRKRRDTHFLNVTGIAVNHDLGMQAGHEIFANFTYFMQEQTMLDDLDLSSFQYEFGGTYKTRFFHFTPSFTASHVQLSRETFLRTQSGHFQISRDFGKWNVYQKAVIERQDFEGISENIANFERKGTYVKTETGLGYLLLPTMRVTAALNLANKSAEEGWNAYDQVQMKFGHNWLLGKGMFLINNFTIGRDLYDEVDATIVARHRADKTFRYRVTYGAPLESLLIGKILPGPFKDVTFSCSYEYYRSHSNITNYTYKNSQFQTLLSKRIQF